MANRITITDAFEGGNITFTHDGLTLTGSYRADATDRKITSVDFHITDSDGNGAGFGSARAENDRLVWQFNGIATEKAVSAASAVPALLEALSAKLAGEDA